MSAGGVDGLAITSVVQPCRIQYQQAEEAKTDQFASCCDDDLYISQPVYNVRLAMKALRICPCVHREANPTTDEIYAIGYQLELVSV